MSSTAPAPIAARGDQALEQLADRDRLRGPKGTRIGDVVVAERSRWQVTDIDPARAEAICTLLGGSHAMRRFRARRIEGIERTLKSGRVRIVGRLT